MKKTQDTEKKSKRERESNIAFTLIELSVVLVIIGLLIGAILVGRDLIKAAEIHSQAAQINKLNTAVITFKLKFDGLPGDLLSTKAQSLGFFASSSGPAAGWGDGNDIITSSSALETPYFRGETVIFWRHLTEAQLIDGSYSATTGAAAGNITAAGQIAVLPTTTDMVNAHLPKAKIGVGASIIAGSDSSHINYFVIAGMNALTAPASNGFFTNSTNPLTSYEASQVDLKMDDGNPSGGTVTAVSSIGGNLPLPGHMSSPTGGCVTSGAYIVNSSTTPNCSLQFKFQ